MYDYESFISVQMENTADVIAKAMKEQVEDNVMKCVQHYVIDCDKERLIKALEYDSDQYDKGFRDGVKTARDIGHWEYDADYDMFYCSVCDSRMVNEYPYCAWCGAHMVGEKE